jgi:hypothetical protein
MLQGCLAGICGLLCLGLSTRLVWPDERLLLIIGAGIIWLLTSLERFLSRYHPWIVAGRAVVAGGVVLILLVIAFVARS